MKVSRKDLHRVRVGLRKSVSDALAAYGALPGEIESGRLERQRNNWYKVVDVRGFFAVGKVVDKVCCEVGGSPTRIHIPKLNRKLLAMAEELRLKVD